MITLILTLALLGLIAYVVTTYIPMPPPFKTLIILITSIVAILYVMAAVGIVDLPIPRLR